MCFYAEEPASAEILSAIRFGGHVAEVPLAFTLAAERFRMLMPSTGRLATKRLCMMGLISYVL